MASIIIDRRDGLSSASAIKGPCRVATTANVVLAGLQTIDGVALVEGDRILCKDQTDARDNGIRIASTGNWERSADFRNNRDISSGTQVYVTHGTVSANRWYGLTSANPVSVGTTNLTFVLSDNLAAAEAAEAAAEAAAASINYRSYTTLAIAQAAAIPASVKRISTQFHTPLYAVPSTLAGGAHYRRVSLADLTSYPTQSYFRSADRFMLDETTDATNGGYWVIDETEVDWRMLSVKADNSTDDTAACQAAMDFVGLSPSVRKLIMFGTCRVSKLTLSVGRPLVVEGVGCMLVGNAAVATTCVLEIKAPDCTTLGSITANAVYSSNYECAIWIWHETQMQFCDFHGLVANNAQIGFRIGSASYPASILSENVLHGPETSGCPYAVQVIGGETYLTIDNPKLSADSFGGDAAWLAKPKCAIQNYGANVTVTGGECLITTDTSTALFLFLPVDRGGGRIEWGSLIVDTVACETGAPLCVIDDAGVTISSPYNKRGMVSFSSCYGYHSQDLAAFIYVTDGYDDYLNVDNLNFWHDGATRTQANIFCEGGSLCEITQRGEFGSGFQTGLAGIQGGRVNFGKRDVVRVKKLNGQAFTAASGPEVCLFQTVDSSGDKARWSSTYNAATGTITVPDGGWEDVTAFITCRVTDMVSGSTRLLLNGNELVRTYFSTACSQICHSLGNLAAGTTLKVDIDIDTNTTAIALDDFNVFCISAKRGTAA